MIELLISKDFPLFLQTRFELEAALAQSGINERIEVRVIGTYGEARKEKFIGSPTIKIDGRDIDYEDTLVFSETRQRMYFFKGKHFPYPPKEMILRAISQIRKPRATAIHIAHLKKTIPIIGRR